MLAAILIGDRPMRMREQSGSAGFGSPTLSRRKKWLFRLAVPLLSAVLVLVLAELYLRIRIPPSDVSLFMFRPDSARYRVMRPNIRGKVYGVPIETNEQGFRARRPYTAGGPAGQRRVVVMGDSMTVCAGIPFEEIFTTRLERLMNETAPASEVEVYNLAVGGHDLLHHAATLKEIGLSYQPHLILMFLYPWNDFDGRNWYDRDRQHAARQPEGDQSLPPALTESWLESLYVYKAFSSPVAHLLWRAGFIKRHQGVVEAFREQSPDWRRSVDALGEIASLARQAGVPCEVVLLPGTSTTFDAQREVYDAAAAACQSAGLPALSLLDAFSATGRSPRHFRINAIDGHPSSEYCAVAARAVFERLLESGAFDRLLAAGDTSVGAR